MKFVEKPKIRVEKAPTFKEKYGKEGQYDKDKDYAKWDANVGRRNRINDFRKNAFLQEDVEITEEIINKNKNAFSKTCLAHGKPKQRLMAELLGQKYTGLEDDDF